MPKFAIIAEGITDQIIIDDILSGYFKSEDINVKYFQPELDETDRNKTTNYGGWSQVLEYCQPKKLAKAFQLNQYIIIQIDTDVSDKHPSYGVAHQDENGEFPVDKIIDLVIEKLISIIGEEFYNNYCERIIFAIAVHSTECWLLPLYYDDKKRAKTKNCLDTLNQEIIKKEGFTIDRKNPDYYRKISRKYCKNKVLMDKYKHNPSFKIFIEDIEKRNIIIEE
jgi:hypothetical protein